MEKGLKWLFGGLIAAVVMMFMLMVSSVDAQETNRYWHMNQGQHMYHMYESCPIYPPSVLAPKVNNNTSSSQNFINNSVTRDNEYRPNVTVNTPKPQR